MPIYEYECRSCEHRFEWFVRPSSTSEARVLACPACESADVTRLLSMFAVSSDGTRQTNLNQARKDNQKQATEKKHADHEYMMHSIREHDH